MTSIKRAGRLPALFLTLLTVGVAALVLTLSTGGGSTAAPAAPAVRHDVAAHGATSAKHAPARSTSGSAAGSTSSDPHAGDSPVQMYLTDTDERRGELIHAWDVCLLDHGAVENTTRAMAVFQGTGVKPVVVQEPIPASAKAACQDKLPILPKETDPSLNDHYVADSAANVACLRDHGVAVHTVPDHSVYPDGLSWTYDNDHVVTPDNEADLERQCEIEAFSS